MKIVLKKEKLSHWQTKRFRRGRASTHRKSTNIHESDITERPKGRSSPRWAANGLWEKSVSVYSEAYHLIGNSFINGCDANQQGNEYTMTQALLEADSPPSSLLPWVPPP